MSTVKRIDFNTLVNNEIWSPEKNPPESRKKFLKIFFFATKGTNSVRGTVVKLTPLERDARPYQVDLPPPPPSS